MDVGIAWKGTYILDVNENNIFYVIGWVISLVVGLLIIHIIIIKILKKLFIFNIKLIVKFQFIVSQLYLLLLVLSGSGWDEMVGKLLIFIVITVYIIIYAPTTTTNQHHMHRNKLSSKCLLLNVFGLIIYFDSYWLKYRIYYASKWNLI
jgi:hypothetical protein